MSINSKNEICNMALNILGNASTVTDIDAGNSDKEITFRLWYNISRQMALKEMMPNFALDRDFFPKKIKAPRFGDLFKYDKPIYCLKVLGIGNIKDKENNYSVEGDSILTSVDDDRGLPVRFVRDITDVSKFSPEFKIVFAHYLASNVCLALTQDPSKAKLIKDNIPILISNLSSINAQENMPIRKSQSLFRKARYSSQPSNTDKK